MSFQQAFARTVGIEGKYSNERGDPGGETCWGITAAVARAQGYTGPMRDLPLPLAKAIYLKLYWNALHLDALDPISPAIAAELFDTGVNCGPEIPIPFLQRALNAFNIKGPYLRPDGECGPLTIAALAGFLSDRGALAQRVMIAALNAQQAMLYLEIVEGRSASKQFIFGWFVNRIIG